MTNLMLIPESLTSGFSALGLDILSFGAIMSGILVITARNPVISVLFLIALFVNIAGYLILLGISFIGLAYITVYVGAIAILFLFVIFLLDIKLAELAEDNNQNSFALGAIIGVAFLYPLYSIIPTNITERQSFTFYVFNWFNSFITGKQGSEIKSYIINNNLTGGIIEPTLKEILQENEQGSDSALTLVNLWDGNFAAFSQISSIGNVMYTSYLFWFFVSSIILLLAMVAAISLTFKPSTISSSSI